MFASFDLNFYQIYDLEKYRELAMHFFVSQTGVIYCGPT